MENSNKPIHPLQRPDGFCRDVLNPETLYGLDKLEYFSGIAMNALIAHANWDLNEGHRREIARSAVKMAKNLLEELEKEKNEN